ncbi:MAG TPA: GWxTD domain-containing protein [Terriglobales bacterium]|nr:GWxTD domain-containing protein [Terriglobales bacterium]
MKAKVTFFFAVVFLFFVPLVFSQSDYGYQEEPEAQDVLVDYSYFRQGDNWKLEVYYKIFNNKMTFVKEQDLFKASYEIELILYNKGKQVTASSHEEEFTVKDYQETQSPTAFLINQVELFAPAGEYKLSFTLNDHNSNRVSKNEQMIILPPIKMSEPLLSGLELARSVRQVGDSISKFIKNGAEIIPSVSEKFGDPDSVLWIYFELYGVTNRNTEDYLLSYELEAGNKTTVFKDTVRAKLLPAFDQTFYDFKKIEIDTMPDQIYTLRLKLLNHQGKLVTKAEKVLRVEWSPLYQVNANWDKAVDLLRYVASDKELKDLRATTGKEERIKKWRDFWKSKDPTPDTPENELMEEYYKRIKYANEHFGIYDKEGYKTDMGLVYVKFGPPDEVDRHPFELDVRAYQVWYYYRLSRKFLFVDVNGYGEYELQYPYEGR